MFKLTTIGSVLGAVAVIGGGAKWTANLESKGGSKVVGTATVELVEGARMAMPAKDSVKPSMPMAKDSVRASISITGSAANATHAWHIHSGTCASIGGAVGMMGSYPQIKTGADGAGKASATITENLGSGDHVVAVHKGSADTETIACGELRSSTMP
jgi:hypothetical protein